MPTSRESLITVLYGSTATGAPTDLYDGEFAFANGSGTAKKLFIGSGGNNTSNWVGAVIEDQATVNWSSVTSENSKLATQYAVKSLASGYLPLSGGSMTGDITLGTTSELNFTATGGGGGTIKIQAPAATTGNAAFTFTLPVNDGSAAEVLTTETAYSAGQALAPQRTSASQMTTPAPPDTLRSPPRRAAQPQSAWTAMASPTMPLRISSLLLAISRWMAATSVPGQPPQVFSTRQPRP
jgi:hypothetical protein